MRGSGSAGFVEFPLAFLIVSILLLCSLFVWFVTLLLVLLEWSRRTAPVHVES